MANTLRLRRGSTAPTAGSFVEGEPAWDSTGKKLYVKAADGSMVLINGAGTGDVVLANNNAFTGANTFANTTTLLNQQPLRFGETTANGTNYVALRAPASIAADITWTLPSTDGASGQVLSTNGTGTLSWATASGSTSASDLTSGTLNDARLSAKVMAAVNTTLWSNFR